MTMTENRLEAYILLQVHRDYIPEPAAIVDHFAGFRLEPADCVLYFKTKMAGCNDDNYDIVIQCQSVWTCFYSLYVVF